MRKFNKKTVAIVAAVATVTGISAGAYAYWTAGGSGIGSASTGTDIAITAVQTSTVTAMGPGVAAQTLTGNFDNTNSGAMFVTSVTASIASVTKDAGAVVGTCDASDYTLSNSVMAVGAEVPAGTAQGAWTGATIEFNNKVTNQDQCKLATVNLAYTIV
jgi:hypothetical protein